MPETATLDKPDTVTEVQRRVAETNLFSHKSLAEKPDETMVSILEETSQIIKMMLDGGASEIKIAWKNIPETANPLRDKGFVRLIGTRIGKGSPTEPKVTYARDN